MPHTKYDPREISHRTLVDVPVAREQLVLSTLLSGNREKLLQELRRRLEKFLPSDYYSMILFDPKGRERTERYVDAFLMALSGDLEYFIKDQQMIGYKRAIEGYPLEAVLSFAITFKNVVQDFISQHNARAGEDDRRISMDEVFYLHSILDHSYYLLSRSYLITRDEIIDERRRQLHDLQAFAGDVVPVLEDEMLWNPLLDGVENIFHLKARLIREPGGSELFTGPRVSKALGSLSEKHPAREILELARKSNEPMAQTPEGEIQPFGDQPDQKDFLYICLPLASRPRQGKVFLLLHDQGRLFPFERFDKNLLSQLVYFAGSVLVNCGMVSELAEKREYLSNLTGILFDIQEKERKRIAADIHDVITQALSGIGFKLILCQELLEKQPRRLEEELNRLVDNVNEALHHSRHIVSDLRPTILDNLGLVAALKKIANAFEENSGVEIEFISPPHLELAPGASIAIFRILQESLHNIRKHAAASHVWAKLELPPDGRLEMTIEDDGKGFEPRQRTQGLGLMLIRERAENLGGQLLLRSSPGDGTTVKVMLPLAGEKRNGPN
ncbi:MAG: sensor histidine kinase [Desulfarculaceae bacterium]|nr:sensor histidine kinase [Desulfarculaceae bacterium]